MRMLKSKYILFAVFLLSAAFVSAQKAERDYIRKGNRLFNDSVFVDAEVNYRKALEGIHSHNNRKCRKLWNNMYRPAILRRIR